MLCRYPCPASRGRGAGFGAGGETAHAQQGALEAPDLLAEAHRLVLVILSSGSHTLIVVGGYCST